MYQFNYHAIAPFVSHVISISVFIFVIFKNPKSMMHLTLGIFCLFASLWQFGTGMMFMSQTDELAIFWDRIVYIGVNFMWMMHFHFSILFSKSEDKKNWLRAAYIIAITYSFFIFTDYLIHDLYRYAWGCHTIAGPLHHSFVLVSTGFYMKSLYLIFRSYMRTDNIQEKKQYKYYFVGFFIYVSATLAYLPAYKISIYPFAYWFETVYCIILVYIIVKHRMLDIETVIHKTLLWLTTSAALLIPSAVLIYFLYPFLVAMSHGMFLLTDMGLVIFVIMLYAIVQPRINNRFQRKKYNYHAIVNDFMDTVVTLNDKSKLAQITEETIKKSLYTETIKCFWMTGNTMSEACATTEEPLQIPLDDRLIEHIVSNNELLERDFVTSDPVHDKFKEDLSAIFEKTNSHLVLPIIHENRIQGVMTLGKKSNLKPYTDLDKQFLKDLSIGISFAIINSLMFETQTELFEKEKEARQVQEELVAVKDNMNKELELKVRERTSELTAAMEELEALNEAVTETRDALWGEMELAKKIQTILLPQKPKIDGYEITAYMAPADEVGGDYYDVINVQNKDWIVIGDVSGHGVISGLVMMMAQTAIHTVLEHNNNVPPINLLTTINESLSKNIQQMSEDKYMTITVLAAHENGEFAYSGHHQDIMVYREKTKTVELVETEGMWIGLLRPIDEMLTEKRLQLEIGDVMLLYTDGVTEAWEKGSQKDERDESQMFGDERLQALFADLSHRSIEEMKSDIILALEEYNCHDDVTFMIIKRTE